MESPYIEYGLLDLLVPLESIPLQLSPPTSKSVIIIIVVVVVVVVALIVFIGIVNCWESDAM